jgi:hypothetical protein
VKNIFTLNAFHEKLKSHHHLLVANWWRRFLSRMRLPLYPFGAALVLYYFTALSRESSEEKSCQWKHPINCKIQPYGPTLLNLGSVTTRNLYHITSGALRNPHMKVEESFPSVQYARSRRCNKSFESSGTFFEFCSWALRLIRLGSGTFVDIAPSKIN